MYLTHPTAASHHSGAKCILSKKHIKLLHTWSTIIDNITKCTHRITVLTIKEVLLSWLFFFRVRDQVLKVHLLHRLGLQTSKRAQNTSLLQIQLFFFNCSHLFLYYFSIFWLPHWAFCYSVHFQLDETFPTHHHVMVDPGVAVALWYSNFGGCS